MRISSVFLTLVWASLAHSAGTTLSFEKVLEQHPDEIKIEPVLYNGMKVDASGAVLCLLAGYQIATATTKGIAEEGSAYVSISGGWGNPTFASTLEFQIRHVPVAKAYPRPNVGQTVTTSVTCRKKLALPTP